MLPVEVIKKKGIRSTKDSEHSAAVSPAPRTICQFVQRVRRAAQTEQPNCLEIELQSSCVQEWDPQDGRGKAADAETAEMRLERLKMISVSGGVVFSLVRLSRVSRFEAQNARFASSRLLRNRTCLGKKVSCRGIQQDWRCRNVRKFALALTQTHTTHRLTHTRTRTRQRINSIQKWSASSY